jgi:serine/threonine-protein kinase
MEFLQGQSLREILDSGVVLPVNKVVDIASQVADGLAFAHESGIVHRDIKPPNIMVLDSGLTKITDFGIALLPAGSRSVGGTVFGSPKYMAPEQVVGRDVDGRADIFSLGAVLYEMLTGFAPFFGGDLDAVLHQVINELPAAPTSRNKSLPPVFDYIVAHAMAKHPDDRYADARAFAADLRNFRDLRPPADLSPEARTLERRAVRRRKGEALPARVADGEQGAAKIAGANAPTPMAEAIIATTAPETPPRGPRTMLFVGVAAALLLFGGATAFVQLFSNRPPAEHSPPAETIAQPAADAAPVVVASSPRVEPAARPDTVTAPAPIALASPPSSRTEASVARPLARLALAVSPWGEVYVDGHKKGISPPLTEIRVAPGKHTIEIRNATFAPYRETVDVNANALVKIKHKFQ